MKTFFSLVLVLLFASVPAFAGEPSSANTPAVFFYHKSLGGQADLRGPNDGCLHTFASVRAERQTEESHLDPSVTNTVIFVTLTRQNVCSGILELNASGVALAEKFNLEKTAVFSLATVRVRDDVSGSQFSVRVKLVWNGFGERTETFSNVNTIQPNGHREENRNSDVSTISSAVGSVSDGTYEYASQYQSATIFREEFKFSVFPVD